MKRQRFAIAAGIDVHRDTVVVTLRRHSVDGDDKLETKTFETFRDSLIEMTQWLVTEGTEAVGLESTGVYWMPVVRVLQEMSTLLVLLVNPLDIKRQAGRKTDVKDSVRISELVLYGLVSPSYLASREQSELRKLTRHRTRLTADQTRYKNRIVKELESSGVKLASVLSECLGVSGRAMIEALLDGKSTPEQIADLAQGVARRNIPTFKRAVQGAFTPSTAFVLRQLLRLLDDVDAQLSSIDVEIERLSQPLKEDRVLLHSAPGIGEVASAAVLAEIGGDMSVFPSARHCTAWAGVCPGSEESAGKSKSAPARKGNKFVRTILVQCSWAAVRTKGSIYQDTFRRLCPRLGPKQAIVAIARKMLTAIYYMLRDRVPFAPTRPADQSPELRARLLRRHMKALQDLGFDVGLTPRATVS